MGLPQLHTEFTTSFSNDSFPLPLPMPPAVESRKTLAPSVIVGVGDIRAEMSRTHRREELLWFSEITTAEVNQLRSRISHYQPVIFVVGADAITDDLIQTILSQFGSHLLFRIILVSNPRSSKNKHSCYAIPLNNPCQPVSVVVLPSGLDHLDWEIDQFLNQGENFAKNCKRLLRINSLNEREHRVANYIAMGLPNKKIASLVAVSEKTIEKCRRDIYSKLGVASGPELASLVTFKNFFRWPKDVAFPTR